MDHMVHGNVGTWKTVEKWYMEHGMEKWVPLVALGNTVSQAVACG